MKKDVEILLVIDNEPMQQFLNTLFFDKYNVVTMPNAVDAFRWLEEGHFPSLIISDLIMPVMDNKCLIRNLKISGFYRYTPIIVLSSMPQSEECLMEWASQIDAYFTKPFNPLQLTFSVDHLLSTNYGTQTAA
ncbi:MAG: response regulator receiver [Flavipsychrobacter sp.]|jgi:CheY-like chemotaxis protein|nr:response regulator receiver [Flavipsychrobacter sp.]